MKLDRNASIPLHTQIQSFLREKILSENLASDAPVPSERELAEELKVSRMTVRQALTVLREEGLIYQKRGKGTFVSSLKMDIHTRNLDGFSDEMKRRGMRPKSRLLKLARAAGSTEVVKKLQLEAGSEIFCLERLRLADEMPMSLETTYLPVKLFPKLDKYDFEKQSLYQILEKKYGFKMYSAAEDLEAAVSDAATSALLEVKKNSPLLIVYRTVFVEGNLPIEYTKSVYRADRYRASFFLVKK
jgi:GntR family transcriptional regulator